MNDRLKQALDFANYQQTLSIQRKSLKEKIKSKLTYGHNGGIFYIDRDLINFVELLCNNGRTSGVVLLDLNDTPILIEDVELFKTNIFGRYFEATNEYYEQFQQLKKSRSVEKLINL